MPPPLSGIGSSLALRDGLSFFTGGREQFRPARGLGATSDDPWTVNGRDLTALGSDGLPKSTSDVSDTADGHDGYMISLGENDDGDEILLHSETRELYRRKGGGGGRGGGSRSSSKTSGPPSVGSRVGTVTAGGRLGGGGQSRPSGGGRGTEGSSVRGGGGGGGAQPQGMGVTRPSNPVGFAAGFGAVAVGAGAGAIYAGAVDEESDGNSQDSTMEFCQLVQSLEPLKNCTSIDGATGKAYIESTQYLIPLARDASNSTESVRILNAFGKNLRVIEKSDCDIPRGLKRTIGEYASWFNDPAGRIDYDLDPQHMCTEEQPYLPDVATTSDVRDARVKDGEEIGKGFEQFQSKGREDSTISGKRKPDFLRGFNDTVALLAGASRSNYTDEDSRRDLVSMFEPYAKGFTNLSKIETGWEPNEKQVDAMNRTLADLKSGTDITGTRYVFGTVKQILQPDPSVSGASSALSRSSRGLAVLAALTASSELAGVGPSFILSTMM